MRVVNKSVKKSAPCDMTLACASENKPRTGKSVPLKLKILMGREQLMFENFQFLKNILL